MTHPPLPVRMALVGAGVFVQKAHLPALLALAPLFEIAAIFSPSGRSAQAVADLLPNTPPVTTDLTALWPARMWTRWMWCCPSASCPAWWRRSWLRASS